MNPAEYFRNEWQLLRTIDHGREKLLNRDQKEVYHEMIYQEFQEGKSYQKIAGEYDMNKSTVCRIISRRKNGSS